LVTEQHVVGVTTNPTIFARAITGSDAYDEQLRDLALRNVGVEEALRMTLHPRAPRRRSVSSSRCLLAAIFAAH
jgi:transaldolase